MVFRITQQEIARQNKKDNAKMNEIKIPNEINDVDARLLVHLEINENNNLQTNNMNPIPEEKKSFSFSRKK